MVIMEINECLIYTGTARSEDAEMRHCFFEPSVSHVYTFGYESAVVIFTLLVQRRLKAVKELQQGRKGTSRVQITAATTF